MYGFGSPGMGSKRMLRGECRRALGNLREGRVSINQEILDKIDDGTYIVAGHDDVSDAIKYFVNSLPNSKVGLAMRSKKLTKQRAKKALLNTSNFGGSESQRRKFVQQHVNEEWLSHLRYGIGETSGVKIKETWLSEERTIEITGINWLEHAQRQIAGAHLLYLVHVDDLEASERPVHHNNRTDQNSRIWLDRNVPSNKTDRTEDWAYFPADDEDGFVTREELHGTADRPSYDGTPHQGPEPKFF